MLTAAKVLGCVVGAGGVWGLIATTIGIITIANYGGYDTLLQGAGGAIYIAQTILGVVLNMCAIALMVILLNIPARPNDREPPMPEMS